MDGSEKKTVAVEACAKINIGLRVGPARADGYHPISGIFHSISLSDRLLVGVGPGGPSIRVGGDFDCPARRTTVYRAAELFFRDRPLRAAVSIDAEKRIPAQAGLGGGSADAAAVLVALDAICGTELPESVLVGMALGIGADVPFFLKGGAAYVEGIGDIVDPVPPRTDFGLLVVKPPFGVSTKWAYAELDAARRRSGEGKGSPTGKAEDMSMFARPPGEWRFVNDFADMLRSSRPEYGLMEDALREAGASFVSVSGSGSCMYGVFADEEEARERSARVRERIASGMGAAWLSGMILYAVKPLETSLFLR